MRFILTVATMLALAVTACTVDESREPPTTPVAPSTTTTQPAVIDRMPGDLRFIALGDSYTEGTSIEPEGSWPYQLAGAFRDRGSVDFDVIAGDGWNAKRLHREISRGWDGSAYDLVLVAIGVNDVVLPFGLDNFREGLDLVAADVAAMSGDGTVVVVLTIPDFRASPWGRERIERGYDIEAYNQVLRSYARGIDAIVVDVTTPSGDTVGDRTMFADDDLHFSARQYAVWVDLILDALA